MFLARDRYGQKPLYYWEQSQGIAFASELHGFWSLPNFPYASIDPLAAAAYFRHGYIPAPRTIYQGVYALLPGHTLEISLHKRSQRCYWHPHVVGSQKLDLDRLESVLDEAVAVRLCSDVPLGAFLSGGIDSAVVVASMAKQQPSPVQTFTIATQVASYDETEAAQRTATHLKTLHRAFPIEPDFVSVSERLAHHYGQPFADYSSVPTYYLSRETRRYVTVAVSGDGGDELFAGYERYAHYRWTALLAHLSYPVRKIFADTLHSCIPARPYWSRRLDFLRTATCVRDKGENASQAYHRYWQERLFQPTFQESLTQSGMAEQYQFLRLYDEATSEHPLERWLEVDQRMYLASDILVKVDIASMAASLECRAPMLDHRFAEIANQMCLSDKIRTGQTKYALRQLAARRIPHEITVLPKKGFTLPLAEWFRTELADWAETMLFKEEMSWQAFLRPEGVHTLWQEHQQGQADHAFRLWTLIAWELWHRTARRPLDSS